MMRISTAVLILLAFCIVLTQTIVAKVPRSHHWRAAQQDRTIEGELERTVEAGGWLILSEGTDYLILNSRDFEGEQWFREGRRVRATGQVKRDVATIYMQGTPFMARSVRPIGGIENGQQQTVRGQLKRTVEPGGWLIDASAMDYLILNADVYDDESWFREGRSVRATGEVKRGTATIYMQGTPFEIRSISPADTVGNRVVTVRSETAAPGDRIQIAVRGFPAGSSVAIGLGPTESEYDIVKRSRTTPSGTLNTSVQVPRYADDGRAWVAVVTTGTGRNMVKTISNIFRISDSDDASSFDGPLERLFSDYLILPGDTLYRIAHRFGVSVEDIISLNPDIADPARIFAGQELKIPEKQR